MFLQVILGRFDDLSFSEDITPSPPPKHNRQRHPSHHMQTHPPPSSEEDQDVVEVDNRRKIGRKIGEEHRYAHGSSIASSLPYPSQQKHDHRVHTSTSSTAAFAPSNAAHDAAHKMLEQVL